MHYGMLLDLSRCVGCGGCVMACKRVNGTLGDVYWCNVYTQEMGKYPNSYLRSMPMGCMHCEDAPCVKHCPTGASYRTEDGFVLVDQEKCIGCRNCVLACPYGAVDIVRRPPDLEPEAAPAQEQGSAPDDKEPKGARARAMAKKRKRATAVVVKCDLCIDHAEGPACVAACPTKALRVIDQD